MARKRSGRILAPLLIVLSLIGVATLFAVPQEPGGEDQLSPEEELVLKRYAERFEEGQRLLGGGKDDAAAKLFRELIEERSDIGAVHHALAIVLRYQNKSAESTAQFLRAAELSPQDAVIQRDAGMNLLDHDLPVRALPLLTQARTLWPDDVEALVAQGRALRRIGRHGAAEDAFRTAVQVEPHSVDAHVGLAHSLMPTRPAESLAMMAKLNHNFFDVNLVHGLALTALKRYDEAAPLLHKGASLTPPGPVGSRFLGEATQALVLGGDVQRAGEVALRWCAVDGPGETPARLPACFALALCRAAVGDHAGAVQALDGARDGPVPAPIRAHISLFAAIELRRADRAEDATKLLEVLAGAKQESFERAASRRLLGKLAADAFAKHAELPYRANDVAWIESLVAEAAGDEEAAETLRKQVRETSDPPGEHPGLLVLPLPE